jgi:hypothetical protein
VTPYCRLTCYPIENVLFVSDYPFDPEKDTDIAARHCGFSMAQLGNLAKDVQKNIFHGNLEKITGKTFVK